MYCTRKFLLQNKLSHSILVRFQVFPKPEVLLTIDRISPLAIIVAYDLLVCLVDLPHFGIYQPTNQMVGNRLIELPPSPPPSSPQGCFPASTSVILLYSIHFSVYHYSDVMYCKDILLFFSLQCKGNGCVGGGQWKPILGYSDY